MCQSHHRSDASSYSSWRSSTRFARFSPMLLANATLGRMKCRERTHKAVCDLRSSLRSTTPPIDERPPGLSCKPISLFRSRRSRLRRSFSCESVYWSRTEDPQELCRVICLSRTRAIHLELVEDCSVPAFLAAFRRFASRRGSPRHVYSDNAEFSWRQS